MSNLPQPPALRGGRLLFVCSMYVTRCVCVQWILTEICTQSLRTSPYWICAHLKLVKIQHKILTEVCTQFFRKNPYWICGHLKLVKIRPEALLKFLHNFSGLPDESLLNLWASKATPSSTEFLTGICGQFSCMNPYWICAHLKLVKIQHESLLNCVHIFSAWILTECVSI